MQIWLRSALYCTLVLPSGAWPWIRLSTEIQWCCLKAVLQGSTTSCTAPCQQNQTQRPLTWAVQAPPHMPAAVGSTCSEGQNLSADHPLVKLVLRLTVEAPNDLQIFFRDAQPLLNWPVLQEACRCLLRLASCIGMQALRVNLLHRSEAGLC